MSNLFIEKHIINQMNKYLLNNIERGKLIMNVFDAIYLSSSDPIEREFMAAESAMDIAVARANKEYEFESGLLALSNNEIFIEKSSASNSDNFFTKAIKAITGAIGDFFTSVADIISGIFNRNREKVKPEDLKGSNIKIDGVADPEKVNKAIDGEISVANKLLSQVNSSKDGISDNTITDWLGKAVKNVGATLGITSIPLAAAFGYDKISGYLKDKKNKAKAIENEALNASNDTEKKKEQKKGIVNGVHKLITMISGPLKNFGVKTNAAFEEYYNQQKSQIEADYKREKDQVYTAYDLERGRYSNRAMSDERHLEATKKLGKREQAIKDKKSTKLSELDKKKAEVIEAEKLTDTTIKQLKGMVKSKEITENQFSGYERYVLSRKKSYDNNSISFNDYRDSIKISNILK